ncbi:MAG: hypothetical protein K9K35_10005 [Rhodoferax sp.]|nr:hypothetical protein [Rhodoferax sp.]
MKRNHDKHTDSATAKHNILAALAKGSYGCKSQVAYAAFPGYTFKNPQGAAFSISKIFRELEDEEFVYTTYRPTRAIYITQKGRRAIKEVA